MRLGRDFPVSRRRVNEYIPSENTNVWLPSSLGTVHTSTRHMFISGKLSFQSVAVNSFVCVTLKMKPPFLINAVYSYFYTPCILAHSLLSQVMASASPVWPYAGRREIYRVAFVKVQGMKKEPIYEVRNYALIALSVACFIYQLFIFSNEWYTGIN